MRRPIPNCSGLTRSRRVNGRRVAPTPISFVVFAAAAVAVLGLALLSNQVPPAGAAPQQERPEPEQISESAMQQIQALLDEKDSRTPSQQKIDSQLLYAMKMQRGQPIAAGIPTLETDVVADDGGLTVVDISGKVSNRLLRRLRANGGQIVHSDASYNSIRASIRLDRLEAIASWSDVKFIQPKQDAMTNMSRAQEQNPRRTVSDLARGFSDRSDRVREFVSLAVSRLNEDAFSPQSVGSSASEGDVTHKATNARTAFGVNGSGIKIGVLSDGVSNLAASQARGDLGPVTVLPGQTGSGDEGTAMLEIIHDLAPGAQLYFATAFAGITSFAQNIRDLRTAGCDIIVDDVSYFVESPFQDGAPGPTNTNGGVAIQAVNDVVAAGAMYFSSAGNSGNLNDGTAGVWEGDFVDGGAASAPLSGGNMHQFAPGLNSNTITANGSVLNLYWSDPLGASANDYDLYRLNAAGTAIAAASTNIQNGTQDPYEQTTSSTVNPRVVILKKTGAAGRFLHLNNNRGRFSIVTTGQTHGHAGATGAFGCAATPASNFAAPPNPAGPFPNPFNSTNTVELFSSDGPRHIFYNANGMPITPGDVSATGGTILQKPDITAADGVSVTGVGGFPSPFFGTSAAAPHAAAIAGLLKSAGPFTNAQIKTALLTTAIDIEAAGTDRDSGAGIVMAFESLNSLGAPQAANVDLGTVTALENFMGGDGILQPGEGGKLTIQLTNTGPANATGISAALTTSTPGVTVTLPGTSAYPDLPATTGMANNTTPYTFTIPPTFACGNEIIFKLTVTYTGGPSPKDFWFTVNTGNPPLGITTKLDSTPPAAGTGFTAATGTQTGRITRVSPPGACGVTKAFPGVTDAANTRQFDAYTFATCANASPYCITVTLANGCTGNRQLFDAVYLGNFDPANIGTNYLTDAAASNIVSGPISFSATIPAGSTFVVVVSDVNTGANSAVGCSYTLSVSGACFGTCTAINQPPVAMCQDVTVSAGANCKADASIDNGSFDPEAGSLTITQSPAGPYPLGTTNVLLTVVDDKGATSQCTGNVTVVDTTSPSIACPASVIAVAAPTCPIATATTVSYSSPVVSDNCPGVTSSCVPAAGSTFPVGATTVTCTATDASGNSSSCSFTVSVYNICLQDDSNPSVKMLINTLTGDYQFSCSGTVFTGTGRIAGNGCTVVLDHSPSDRRVHATLNTTSKVGNAIIQLPIGKTKCMITDRNMANNNCP